MTRLPSRRLLWPILLLVLIGLACASVDNRPSPTYRLTILHFNDLHGYLQEHQDSDTGATVGGMARMATLVKQIREQNQSVGVPTLWLHAGDLLTGSPLSSVHRGMADVEVLDYLQLDATTVGNHDLDFGRDRFDELVRASKFTWIVSNFREDGKAFPWLALGFTRRDPSGLNVGIVGVTTPELITGTNPKNVKGLAVDDPVPAVRAALKRVGGPGSVRIALSHGGLDVDKRLAREIEDLHVIIGGHDQNVFEAPLVENGKWIVQAGEHGEHLGRLDLEITAGRVKLVRYKVYAITPEVPEDRIVKAMVDGYLAGVAEKGREVIGETLVRLDAGREIMRRAESNLGDFVTDLVRARLKTDVALLNGGGFRASLAPGPITVGNVLEVFPFGDTLFIVKIPGRVLRAAIENGLRKDPSTNPGAFLQVSGMAFQIDNKRAVNIRVGGEPLVDDKEYTVAINEFMALGGDDYAMLKGVPGTIDTGIALADLVIETIRQQKKIDMKTDGRITRLAPWTAD
jgi:2',3'-cyclic-nucleotide 2'-phosphodiesterase (5'-nucleotidase family)